MDHHQLVAMARPASPSTTNTAAPHVAHKIPAGDGPYARAKHFQVRASASSIDFHALREVVEQHRLVAIQLEMDGPLLGRSSPAIWIYG
jgi:hypothetical protein